MQTQLIREIAETIVREEFLLNWQLYAAIGAVSLVASAIGNGIGSYFRKRGETYATKADANEILRQLSESTKATEEIRTTIAHADWAAREWRKTRRLKLEQLLAAAYSLDRWLDLQRAQWVHGEPPSNVASPMIRLKLLGTLYFPELQSETNKVWSAYQNCNIFLLEIGQRTQPARANSDVAAHKKALDDLTNGWEAIYKAAYATILELEKKSAELMNKFGAA